MNKSKWNNDEIDTKRLKSRPVFGFLKSQEQNSPTKSQIFVISKMNAMPLGKIHSLAYGFFVIFFQICKSLIVSRFSPMSTLPFLCWEKNLPKVYSVSRLSDVSVRG